MKMDDKELSIQWGSTWSQSLEVLYVREVAE